MKLSRRGIPFVLLMLFAMSILAGCGAKVASQTPNPEATKPKNSALSDADAKLQAALAPLPKKGSKAKLAALEITLANPFWVTMKQGYEDAAKDYGATIDVLAAPKENDINSQLEALQTLLSKDYNAIGISPMTGLNLIPGVAEANKKGVPIIAVGTNVDLTEAQKAKASISAYLTTDFEGQGKMAADYIMSKVSSGKVAIIEGLPDAPQGVARREGAKKEFATNKNITLVSVQPGNWDQQTAYNIAQNLLQANPDLKGIFCANDIMALGAVTALKTAGKKDQIVVVGIDFIDQAKESITKGELDATVAMSPYLFGKGGVLMMLKVTEGQKIDHAIDWSPNVLVTKSNVSAFDGWK